MLFTEFVKALCAIEAQPHSLAEHFLQPLRQIADVSLEFFATLPTSKERLLRCTDTHIGRTRVAVSALCAWALHHLPKQSIVLIEPNKYHRKEIVDRINLYATLLGFHPQRKSHTLYCKATGSSCWVAQPTSKKIYGNLVIVFEPEEIPNSLRPILQDPTSTFLCTFQMEQPWLCQCRPQTDVSSSSSSSDDQMDLPSALVGLLEQPVA